MVRRTETAKTFSVSKATYDRFVSYKEYSETFEGLLNKVLDKADVYDKIYHKGKYKNGNIK